MRKIYFLLAFSIFSFKALALADETTSSVALEKLFKLEAGLQGIGLGYELPLAQKWSVNVSAGLGAGHDVDSAGFADDFNMHLGLGYAADFYFNNSQFYPAAGVQFAYILSRSVE